jgi:putative phosphoribosyl transferase
MNANAGQLEADMVEVGRPRLAGRLYVPENPHGLVLCIDETGSSLLDARHVAVASALTHADMATLTIDLLTAKEHAEDRVGGSRCNDIQLLAGRVLIATDWLGSEARTGNLPIGYFGTGIGGAVALAAAAERPVAVSAIAACNGRPLLVRAALPQVRAPTLLITTGDDVALARLNRAGLSQMFCKKCLEIVPSVRADGVELPKEVGSLAGAWFERHLLPPPD